MISPCDHCLSGKKNVFFVVREDGNIFSPANCCGREDGEYFSIGYDDYCNKYDIRHEKMVTFSP